MLCEQYTSLLDYKTKKEQPYGICDIDNHVTLCRCTEEVYQRCEIRNRILQVRKTFEKDI